MPICTLGIMVKSTPCNDPRPKEMGGLKIGNIIIIFTLWLLLTLRSYSFYNFWYIFILTQYSDEGCLKNKNENCRLFSGQSNLILRIACVCYFRVPNFCSIVICLSCRLVTDFFLFARIFKFLLSKECSCYLYSLSYYCRLCCRVKGYILFFL